MWNNTFIPVYIHIHIQTAKARTLCVYKYLEEYCIMHATACPLQNTVEVAYYHEDFVV